MFIEKIDWYLWPQEQKKVGLGDHGILNFLKIFPTSCILGNTHTHIYIDINLNNALKIFKTCNAFLFPLITLILHITDLNQNVYNLYHT